MSALLFLHPLGADRTFWNPVIELLPDLTCESIDLPGHGTAPALPVGATIADFADVVAAHIESTGGDSRTVVGLSLGGLVAMQLAATRAELVDRLIVADAVAVYPEAMVAMWHERAAVARAGGIDTLAEPMVSMWFTEELAAAGDDRVSHARTTFVATPAEGYARACEALAAADLTEVVGTAVNARTTVVCGTEDAEPFVRAASWLADALPDARLRWIDGAKHASAAERPDEFAAIVRTFVGAPAVS